MCGSNEVQCKNFESTLYLGSVFTPAFSETATQARVLPHVVLAGRAPVLTVLWWSWCYEQQLLNTMERLSH